jgi:hypothetical protein
MENKMRKIKIRNIAYVLTSIAAISIIAVVFFFLGANSAEKKQYELQLRQESQAFTDKLISELDQVKTSGTAAGTIDGEAASTETPFGIITGSSNQIDSEEPARPDDARKQQVLQTLSAAYSKVLNKQKSEALSIVVRLVE